MNHLRAIPFWITVTWVSLVSIVRLVEYGIERYVLAMVGRTAEA